MVPTRQKPLVGIVLLGIFAGLCGGCLGRSEPARFYTLAAGGPPTDSGGTVAVAVGPLQLPDYLDRAQIVVRDQETGIQLRSTERWAEPLEDAMIRRLTNRLNNALQSAFVYRYPQFVNLETRYQVGAEVYAFEADTNGQVRLQLRWTILDEDRNAILKPRGANYATEVASASDTAAVTVAMGGLLDMFAADIAAELNRLGVD